MSNPALCWIISLLFRVSATATFGCTWVVTVYFAIPAHFWRLRDFAFATAPRNATDIKIRYLTHQKRTLTYTQRNSDNKRFCEVEGQLFFFFSDSGKYIPVWGEAGSERVALFRLLETRVTRFRPLQLQPYIHLNLATLPMEKCVSCLKTNCWLAQ